MTAAPIYLDFNATTPCDPRVVEAMVPFFATEPGNTSSLYGSGRRAHAACATARKQVAALIGAAHDDEILFTSGGTESNTLAIVGAALASAGRKHVVISNFEHPAVSQVVQHLVRDHGFSVTAVPVSRDGFVSAADVIAALSDQTALVSVMLANNEVGTIQPLAEIAAATRARGIVLHSDAAQAVGKVPVDVERLGVDLLTIVGHKFYAPKGSGCLYVRRGTPLRPIVFGGGQERGLRSGTLNVPYIVALGEACRIAQLEAVTEAKMRATAALRDRLFELLRDGLRALGIEATRHSVGDIDRLLPNTLSVALHGIVTPILLHKVQAAVEASAGSACHLDANSVTLEAMGVGELSASTLRLSLGRATTLADVERAAAALVETAPRATKAKVLAAAAAAAATTAAAVTPVK